MHIINDTVNQCWPCGCSIWTGYVLAPFTLGMSFLIPNMCIKDAKQNLIYAVERQNRIKLKDKGLRLRFVQGWGTSWLEIYIISKKLVDKAVQEYKKDVLDPENIPSEQQADPVKQDRKKLSTQPSSESLANRVRESPQKEK